MWFVVVVCLVWLVFGFFLWGNLFSFTSSLQLLVGVSRTSPAMQEKKRIVSRANGQVRGKCTNSCSFSCPFCNWTPDVSSLVTPLEYRVRSMLSFYQVTEGFICCVKPVLVRGHSTRPLSNHVQIDSTLVSRGLPFNWYAAWGQRKLIHRQMFQMAVLSNMAGRNAQSLACNCSPGPLWGRQKAPSPFQASMHQKDCSTVRVGQRM